MLIEDNRTLPKNFPFEIQHYTEKRVVNKKAVVSHWHDFLEITYVEEGSARYFVDDGMFQVEAGDIILFNHLESHRWEVLSEELSLTILLFSSRIISDSMNCMDLEYLIPFLSRGSGFKNKIPKGTPYVQQIKAVMDEILLEQQHQSPGYLLMIKADILRILTILVRYYQNVENGTQELKRVKNAALRVEEALLYMKENYDKKITLNEMATLVCMSPNYFSGYFRKVTGMKFQECLTTIRMEKAKEKLKNTEEGIIEIAHSCGVANLANFYRLYKKCYGIPPGEERHPHIAI